MFIESHVQGKILDLMHQFFSPAQPGITLVT